MAVLSADSNNGDVKQRGKAKARGGGEQLVAQSIRQEGRRRGTENTASQGAGNHQVLAAALGPALAIPVNADVPVDLLGAGDGDGDVTQDGKADSKARSANNDVRQEASQSDSQQAVSKMLSNVAEAMSDGSSAQDMLGGL